MKYNSTKDVVLNEVAVKMSSKLIKLFEGCNLIAYPDPGSDLYKALSRHGMLTKYMQGKLLWKDLAKNFQDLNGNPFTCGYGETNGVTKDTVYTQQEADTALERRVRIVMTQCIKDCSVLATESPERLAAITSLTYNIGNRAFKDSTACRLLLAGNRSDVTKAMQMFNMSGGMIVDGLVKRRKIEADLFNSVK